MAGQVLTPRQHEVATMLRDGWRHSEIAARLGISEQQVARLVAQARSRVAARTTYELVALLVAGRLQRPPD